MNKSFVEFLQERDKELLLDEGLFRGIGQIFSGIAGGIAGGLRGASYGRSYETIREAEYEFEKLITIHTEKFIKNLTKFEEGDEEKLDEEEANICRSKLPRNIMRALKLSYYQGINRAKEEIRREKEKIGKVPPKESPTDFDDAFGQKQTPADPHP